MNSTPQTDRYALDNRLLNQGESLWGNLGYWSPDNPSYPQAAAQLAEVVGQAAQLHEGMRLLDVGYGYGDSLFYWLERFKVNPIIGLEVMLSHVRVAQARAREKGATASIYPWWGSATTLGQFKSATFEAIISLDSAYHYQPRSQFFAEAYRLLKSGGRLVLTDLHWAGATAPPRFLWAWLSPLAAIPPDNLLTWADYRATLHEVGFKRVSYQPLTTHVYGGFARFIGRLGRNYFWRYPRGGWPKLVATGLVCAMLSRYPRLAYGLIVAER